MSISQVISLLERERPLSVDSGFYSQIDLWHSWWRGFCPQFHRYLEKGPDGAMTTRRLYSLRMAKKVSEDWAALLLNEKTALTLSDPAADRFLQGANGLLHRLSFWQRANTLVERAFSLGTGAFLLRLQNLSTTPSGTLLPTKDATIHLEYLPAQCIVPISVVGGEVTEAAFCSHLIQNGKPMLYIETHTLENGCYKIENRYFAQQSGRLRPMPLPGGMLPVLYTESPVPLFSLVRPNLVNHLSEYSGMGLSVFADAIDCLEGVDLAFNNFCRDFKLGGKKVFLNRSLVTADEHGRMLTPDDLCRQLFLTLGERLPSESQLIYEHNPSLRVEENVNGLQAQLDYLSFRCGLGNKHYRFNTGSLQTATEYMGDRQALAQNVRKHQLSLENSLRGIFRAMLCIGSRLYSKFDPTCEITLQFDDSVIVDRESERERDRSDVRDGLMLPFEYRMRWYAEDEETAKAAVLSR